MRKHVMISDSKFRIPVSFCEWGAICASTYFPTCYYVHGYSL